MKLNNNTPKLICALFMCLLFISCTRYTLSEKDLEWQPYEVADRLIFISDKGEIDTIVIDQVHIVSNADDPLSIYPNMNQTIFIGVENRRPSTIIELHASKYGKFIDFNLQLGNNDLKYTCFNIKIGKVELTQQPFSQYQNVYQIPVEQSCNTTRKYPFDIRYIYWSMEYGYVGMEFKNGYTWTLQSFYRGGVELLQ